MIHFLALLTLASSPADLVIENARIWSDGMTGFAEFAAVANGRFVYVGDRRDEFIGPNTERVDARARVVIPGIVDSHVHMLSGGLSLNQLHLRDASDREDFVRRVRAWAANLPDGRWVTGGRWSVESWPDRTQPTKEWIDPVTLDRPVYLSRMDGHSALVNSAALRMAGITREGPPNPVGGAIDRDPETGEPTGILRESAMGLVSRLIPPASFEDKVSALKLAMAHANSHGITAVADIPSIADLAVYEAVAAEGEMTVRFFLYPTAGNWAEAAVRARAFKGEPMWAEVKGFKAYLDGTLGSRTAKMAEPFLGVSEDHDHPRGLWREGVEDSTFSRNMGAAMSAGMQTIVHAIGDEANRFLLDTLAATYPNLAAARCRSEHAQHLLPADVGRFGLLKVIASMQPYHKADDGRYCEDYIGTERSRSSYAFKSLLDAGAVLAFGSDWPVVTINPFLGIETAVTGRIMDRTFWMTQENITVAEALRSYTSSGAYGVFAETEIGRIATGYRADFVILNRPPFDSEFVPVRLVWGEIAPVSVYVEGRKAP